MISEQKAKKIKNLDKMELDIVVCKGGKNT
jgi:hypothetical protein